MPTSSSLASSSGSRTELALPRRVDQRRSSSQGAQASERGFAEAAEAGRLAEAHRQLEKLERVRHFNIDSLSQTLVELTRRVYEVYENNAEDRSPDEAVVSPLSAGSASPRSAPLANKGWLRKQDESTDHVECKYRASGGSLEVRATRRFEGYDALQAFIGLCEYDMCAEYDSRVVGIVNKLEERLNDSMWNVRMKTHAGKEDNILQISSMDALDEAQPLLWVAAYTPEEGCKELRGVRLPPAKDNAVRVGFQQTVFTIEPQSALDDVEPTFILTIATLRRRSSAALCFPAVIVKEVTSIIANFHNFLEKNRDVLMQRERRSFQAPFYAAVRRRIEQKWPSEAFQRLAAAEGLQFQELSSYLPDEWANARAVFDLAPTK